MATATALEVALEAQGSLPNFRYEIILPLMAGRVKIDGVDLVPSAPMEACGYYEKDKFKNGEFGLVDTNIGDIVPAIDSGWKITCLPVFIKRKPFWNYCWVRTDRGINSPKDLEGKTFASVGYGSTITIYTRGYLQHDHGVDILKIKWLLNGAHKFDLHGPQPEITIASGPPKPPWRRLLDGEVDAITGDITDSEAWRLLESSSSVRRLFPNYREMSDDLIRNQNIFSPVHAIAMSSTLNEAHPGLSKKLYDAFNESKDLAYDDHLSDKASSSMLLYSRESMRDQLASYGDVYAHGVKHNRNAMDIYFQFSQEQGITKELMTTERFYAKGTLET
jgi:4,5-dihydroxyphthalate decarboxylase